MVSAPSIPGWSDTLSFEVERDQHSIIDWRAELADRVVMFRVVSAAGSGELEEERGEGGEGVRRRATRKEVMLNMMVSRGRGIAGAMIV